MPVGVSVMRVSVRFIYLLIFRFSLKRIFVFWYLRVTSGRFCSWFSSYAEKSVVSSSHRFLSVIIAGGIFLSVLNWPVVVMQFDALSHSVCL